MVSFYEVQGKAVETRYSSLKARHHRCVYDAYLSILTSYIPIFNRRNIQNYNYFRPYVIICLTSYKRKLQNSASSFSHYHFIVVICAHRKRANSRLKNKIVGRISKTFESEEASLTTVYPSLQNSARFLKKRSAVGASNTTFSLATN